MDSAYHIIPIRSVLFSLKGFAQLQ